MHKGIKRISRKRETGERVKEGKRERVGAEGKRGEGGGERERGGEDRPSPSLVKRGIIIR